MNNLKKISIKSIFITALLKIVKMFIIFALVSISPFVYLYIVGPVSSKTITNYVKSKVNSNSRSGLAFGLENINLFWDSKNFGLGIDVVKPFIDFSLAPGGKCQRLYTDGLSAAFKFKDIIRGDFYNSLQLIHLKSSFRIEDIAKCNTKNIKPKNITTTIGELKSIIYAIDSLDLELEIQSILEPLKIKMNVDKLNTVANKVLINFEIEPIMLNIKGTIGLYTVNGELVLDIIAKDVNFSSIFKYLDSEYQDKNFDITADLIFNTNLFGSTNIPFIKISNLNGFIQGRNLKASITSQELNVFISKGFSGVFIQNGQFNVNQHKILLDFYMDRFLNYKIKPSLENFTINNLLEYWPKDIGILVRKWIKAHIEKGNIKNLLIEKKIDKDFRLEFRLIDSKISKLLSGKLPAVIIDEASLLFEDGILHAISSNSKILDTKIHDASLRLDINNDDEMLKINTLGSGSIKDLIKIAKNLSPKIPIDINKVDGEAETELHLLLKSNDMYNLDIRSDFINLNMDSIVKNINISKGNGQIILRNDDLYINCQALINKFISSKISFEQNIKKDSKSKLLLNIANTSINNLKHINVDIPDQIYMAGTFGANLEFAFYPKYFDLNAYINLAKSEIRFDHLIFEKQQNKPATVKFNIKKDYESEIIELKSYKIDMHDFLSIGAGELSENLKKVHIESTHNFIKDSNFNFIFDKNNQGTNLELFGESLHIAIDKILKKNDTNGKLKLHGNLKKLSLGRGASMLMTNINMDCTEEKCTNISLNSTLNSGAKFELFYDDPVLSIVSNDAGCFLEFFGIEADILGGDIEIKGSFDNKDYKKIQKKNDKALKFKGYASINKFSMRKNATLAHVFSIISIPRPDALIKAIGEKLIPFKKFHTNIEIDKYDIISFNNILADGPFLQINGSGFFDIDTTTLDIEGRIIPVSLLNSILGKIPLFGQMISGNKDGNIFYAIFKIAGKLVGDKSGVKVNISPAVPTIFGEVIMAQNGVNKAKSKIIQSKLEKEGK